MTLATPKPLDRELGDLAELRPQLTQAIESWAGLAKLIR